MEKRRIGKTRQTDEQLPDIINFKIMFRFFDGLSLFRLHTLIAFYTKKESAFRFAL